jgi:hypothetical protein
MPYYPQLVNMDAHPFQPVQWRVALDETVEAEKYFARTGSEEEGFMPNLGTRRYENAFMGGGVYKDVKVHGQAIFRWAWNNSGGDFTAGQVVQRRANQTISNLDSGGLNYAAKAATFTADKEFGGIMHVADNNAAAEVAPENEHASIYENDATTIYFQPDLSAVLKISDDLVIAYLDHIIAGAIGARPADSPAIVMAATLANGYMGWVCEKADAVRASVVAAGTAVTTDKGLIVTTGGLLTNGSTSNLGLIVAYALFAVSTNGVVRKIMVKFDGSGALGASA